MDDYTETIVKEEDYWECDRCHINNLGERMCPCPRGGCEAEPIGVIVTSVRKKNDKT